MCQLEPWLPLYKVWGLGSLQRGGSPDQRVESLREVLANLAYKLRRLLMLARVWLSSWSCGHVAAGSDVVLLCWPWQHYSTVMIRQLSYTTRHPSWSSPLYLGFPGRCTHSKRLPWVIVHLVAWCG